MTMHTYQNRGAELTIDTLRRLAPAVFAEAAHESRSARYTYYPTLAVVEAMTAEGWAPVAVSQASVRTEGRAGFQKHAVKFARRDDLARWADFFASGAGMVGRHSEASKALARVECLMTNSHDGTSGYKIHAGLFRPICTNGLIVSDGSFDAISVPHKGHQARAVVDASMVVVRRMPEILGQVDEMRAQPLSMEERVAFAEAAAIVRFGDLETAPIAPQRLLEPHRMADRDTDAWTVLNVVQENVIRGGQRGRAPTPDGKVRKVTTRAVAGIDGNVALNKALWHLATKLGRGDIAPASPAV